MFKIITDIVKEQIGEFGNLSPENITIFDAPLIGTNNILNKDGSLTTIIAINGSFKIMGNNNFNEMAEYLMSNLKGPLKRPGHFMSVSYNKDNFLTKQKIREGLSAGWRKGKYGFQVSDILSQQEDVLGNRVSYEQGYLTITTTTAVLPKATANKARKKARETFMEATKTYFTEGQQARHTQIPRLFVKDILKTHDAFVNNINNVLKEFLDTKILNHHEAVRELRSFYYPECAGPFFKAKIYNNHAHLSVYDNSRELSSHKISDLIVETEKKGEDSDISNLLYPGLTEQIILSDAFLTDDRIRESGTNGVVRIGKRYYAPILLSSPPEMQLRFDELFKSIDFKIPFRMTMNMETGFDKFVGKLNMIKGTATMLAVTNSDNKRVKDASSILIDNYKNGYDIPINTHTLFVTWGETPEVADSNRDNIVSALQSWGSADAVSEFSDPYLSCLEAIPSFTRKRTAPGFIKSLSEVILSLPYTRPSSPWKSGTLTFYTKENKTWPYSLGSSEQQTWIELISAGPGSGKSVWMAASNISLLLNEPNDNLPKIGIIDVGPSSKYMCDLMQSMLPDRLKSEVASYKIKMAEEYAFNPFDTLLGCRYPVAQDKSFLINFLTLVLTPIDSDGDIQGLTELVSLLIAEAYKYCDPDENLEECVKYAKGVIPELDKVIEEYEVAVEGGHPIVDKTTPLFYIVDALMDMIIDSNGDYNQELELVAKKAQSFAVPRLPMLSSVLNKTQIIRDQYKDDKGQDLLAMCTRQITFAVNAYPILVYPSRFDIGTASIVSLDLSEIVQTGSKTKQSVREASISYLLARFMIGKNYYRDKDTVREVAVPEKYRRYHLAWIEKEHVRKKRICMDEFHTTDATPAMKSQVEMDMRTGRKYNVIVTLASQRDADFSETMRELSTTTFIMGKSSQSVRKQQQKEYGLDDDIMDALKNYVTSPTEKGSSMIIFGESKKSSFSQMVYYLPPPLIIWGLSTTTEDVTLREYVKNREGDYLKSLVKISQVFRQGTAKSTFERYKANGLYTQEKGKLIETSIAEQLYRDEISKVKIEEIDINYDLI
jgi:intracellular multiplication protein IcmB